MTQQTQIGIELTETEKKQLESIKRGIEAILDKKYKSDPISFFKSMEYQYALAYIPFLRKKIAAIDPEQSDMTLIPINQDIEGTEGIALPEEVVNRLIDISNYRVAVDFCACRMAYKCENYPQETGCIFMGESAKFISKKHCREISRDEAKAHVKKAVDAGLVPFVGDSRVDHDLLKIPETGRLMTLCLCCECCCLSRFFKRGPADVINGIVEPIDGLTMKVTDDCVGCGDCVDKCFVEGIMIEDDKAVMNEYCVLCGRCAGACPQNAIKLKLTNPNAVDDVVNRITERIDLT